MNSPYLTDAEIADLTRPLVQGKARCRYLEEKYGLKVVPRPDGQPRVGRAEFEAAMMSKDRIAPAAAPRSAEIVYPDWGSGKGFKKAS